MKQKTTNKESRNSRIQELKQLLEQILSNLAYMAA